MIHVAIRELNDENHFFVETRLSTLFIFFNLVSEYQQYLTCNLGNIFIRFGFLLQPTLVLKITTQEKFNFRFFQIWFPNTNNLFRATYDQKHFFILQIWFPNTNSVCHATYDQKHFFIFQIWFPNTKNLFRATYEQKHFFFLQIWFPNTSNTRRPQSMTKSFTRKRKEQLLKLNKFTVPFYTNFLFDPILNISMLYFWPVVLLANFCLIESTPK